MTHSGSRACCTQVDYFGVATPLKQMGTVSVPDSTTLLIAPFDKASLKDIEKALNESDLGINPNNDGEKIRLAMPSPTQVAVCVCGGGAAGHAHAVGWAGRLGFVGWYGLSCRHPCRWLGEVGGGGGHGLVCPLPCRRVRGWGGR